MNVHSKDSIIYVSSILTGTGYTSSTRVPLPRCRNYAVYASPAITYESFTRTRFWAFPIFRWIACNKMLPVVPSIFSVIGKSPVYICYPVQFLQLSTSFHVTNRLAGVVYDSKCGKCSKCLYAVDRKNTPKCFSHIFYKTQPILTKFVTYCPA